MVLDQLEVCIQENANRPIMSLYKAQVQVIKDLQIKPRQTEAYRGESGDESWTHRHSRKVPEPNTNGLSSKNKDQQMGPHKTAKLLEGKGHGQ